MSLEEYKKKRDFKKTPEPEGVLKKSNQNLFVIQKHKARRLHYDLRIEIASVLKSWAIPKGPSLNPMIKRLAIETEDHPLDYAQFEGIIPKDNYGGGTVIVWDLGTYENKSQKNNVMISMSEAHRKGHIIIKLNGKKIKGEFNLIRMKKNDKWLLIKKNDSEANNQEDILEIKSKSVLSNKTLEEVEESYKN